MGWDGMEFPYLCTHSGLWEGREDTYMEPTKLGVNDNILRYSKPGDRRKRLGKRAVIKSRGLQNCWEPNFFQGVWNASVHTEAKE